MVIYKIYSKSTDKIYIGSTVNYKRRKNQHINALKNNRHHNFQLQKLFNTYGIGDLEFSIIENVNSHDLLIEREEYYIKKYEAYSNGLNLKEYFQRKQKFNLSQESKNKIRKSLKGRKKSKEHIENMSKAGKGNPKYGLRGKKRSVNQINNIRNGVLNSHKQKIAREKAKKPIEQYTLDGIFIKKWDSIIEACNFYNMTNSSNLIKVLKGKGKSCNGYYWKYIKIQEDKLKENS